MQQKITNCEKLKMLSLTDKGSKLHKKITMFAEKKINGHMKLYMGKIQIMIIILRNVGLLHILRSKNINEITVILYNGSKYDYHLIIKIFTE